MSKNPERDNRIAELVRDGYSLRATARRVGVSHEIVRRTVKANGIIKGAPRSDEERMREIANSVVLEHLSRLPCGRT